MITSLIVAINFTRVDLKRISCNYQQNTTCLIRNLTLEENDEVQITNAKRIVNTISIDDNKISCFPCNFDVFFPNVNFLNISNSTIEKFSLNDLEKFLNLQEVTLNGNDIIKFDTNYSGTNQNLLHIHLQNNNINLFSIIATNGSYSAIYFRNNTINSNNKSRNITNQLVIIIIILVILLIGSNAAFFIALRKKAQFKTTSNSQTELTVMHYEEVNKNSILNPFNELKHENLYSEDTNYEEIVHTKSNDDEDFYAEIPLNIQNGSKSEIVENKDESLYTEM